MLPKEVCESHLSHTHKGALLAINLFAFCFYWVLLMVLLSPGDLPSYYLLVRESDVSCLQISMVGRGLSLCLHRKPKSVAVPSVGAASWDPGQSGPCGPLMRLGNAAKLEMSVG